MEKSHSIWEIRHFTFCSIGAWMLDRNGSIREYPSCEKARSWIAKVANAAPYILEEGESKPPTRIVSRLGLL